MALCSHPYFEWYTSIEQIFRPNHIPYEVGHIHNISSFYPAICGWNRRLNCHPYSTLTGNKWMMHLRWYSSSSALSSEVFARRAAAEFCSGANLDSRNHGACWVYGGCPNWTSPLNIGDTIYIYIYISIYVYMYIYIYVEYMGGPKKSHSPKICWRTITFQRTN